MADNITATEVQRRQSEQKLDSALVEALVDEAFKLVAGAVNQVETRDLSGILFRVWDWPDSATFDPGVAPHLFRTVKVTPAGMMRFSVAGS